MEKDKNQTSAALLEQLVYIDNFINSGSNSTAGDQTPNLDMDGQLSIDLAAFADDSFIFPDEDKPKDEGPSGDQNDFDHNFGAPDPHMNPLDISPIDAQYNTGAGTGANKNNVLGNINLSLLPKFPVPPGAKSSLESAGLSQNQIDLLSALIAQHQHSQGNQVYGINPENAGGDPEMMGQSSSMNLWNLQYQSPVRQHNLLQSDDAISIKSESTTMFETPTPQTPFSNQEDNASEFDKRRRNTAASARFRIKKKMKEKQMEDKISNLNQSIKQFENKIQQLEVENRILRTLIIEKGSEKSDNELKMLKERARSGI